MTKEFMRVEMLPALHGDCLFVEWGDEARIRRMLIDGGPIGAYEALETRMASLLAGDKQFELMVLSHVDTDHVDGLIRLFANPPPWSFVVEDVWFNGWRHLEPETQILGGKQGEYFSALLAQRLPKKKWNGAFDGKAVCVPDDGKLPQKKLAGDMVLTLLSPTPTKLVKMRDAWRKDLGDAITPGDLERGWSALSKQKRYLPDKQLLGSTPTLDALLEKQSHPDDAAANGSSISFLAEFAGMSCLFLADAHPDVICASIRRLLKERGGLSCLAVDAVKVAHHGSKGNTTDELMSLINCPKFLISTNGAQFKHPDREAISRLIGRSNRGDLTLYFNYKSEHNKEWAAPTLQSKLKYWAVYPDAKGSSIKVSLD